MPITKQSPRELIKSFQSDLVTLNYNVGKSGADGYYGNNTKGAVHDFCEDHHLPFITGDEVPDEIVNRIATLAIAKRNVLIKRPAKFLDLTRVSDPSDRRGVLPWTEREGGELHNTGCPLTDIPQKEVDYFLEHDAINLANTPSLMRWAKHHSETLADGTKIYQALKAHYGITYSGWILNIHPINNLVWHGHGMSPIAIGYEIAGFMLGVEDDPLTLDVDEEDLKTKPGGPWKIQSVTEAQIESMHNLIDYDVSVLAQHGSKYQYLDTHREWAPNHSRRCDPGSKIVQRIQIPMQQKHGLIVRPIGWTGGKSKDPMPELWDKRCKGIKF